MRNPQGSLPASVSSNDWHRDCVTEEARETNVMNRNITLLELVCEVSREVRTEAEVVERVSSLVNSGRVRLSGSFRDTRFDEGHLVPGRARSERRAR